MVLGIPAIDLIVVFLFLIPGFLTYRIGKYVGKVTITADRFDKAVYSLIASGSAIAFVAIGASIVGQVNVSSSAVSTYSTPQIATGYVLVLVVSTVQGILIGVFIDRCLEKGNQRKRERVWKLTFEGTEQPIESRTVTKSGQEIHGYIQIYDSVGHGKDILIEYPTEIFRRNGTVIKKKAIGEHVFVSEIDISHIYFENEVSI